MFLESILYILLILFFVSCFGYLFVILKEKYYLKHNMIYIDSKAISECDIEEVETKHFMLGSVEIMAGDEMKFHMNNNNMFKGIILGANVEEKSIILLTSKNKVKSIYVQDIKNYKIISKYGKLFKKI